ncbi:hypothetical protein [Bacillus infantis]|jgi:hypothetical protein|uniref:hypothetical protein n=1 Tax=Bacillus infantis TaxID=324767 RepID=UPI002155EBE4|nr:hypothetical protein [Bacillus infantis]MCR6609153.1 hypothetical protein [Bacillus infantis]
MKYKKEKLVLAGIVIIFLLLHSTPHLALRTHVFISGYPGAALTSGIIEDDYHNKADSEKFSRLNGKAYTLTEPPIEKATAGQLRNYLVRKFGFLYFAEYYGEA